MLDVKTGCEVIPSPDVKHIRADARTGIIISEPIHMISVLDWELNSQYKAQKAAGHKPCVIYPDGSRRFNPYLEIVSKILSPEHCQKALLGQETYYYTSGKENLGIIYGDTDAHFDFQTDKDRASRFVRAAFPMAFNCQSPRGVNDLVKVYHGGELDRFNKLCYRLQAAMRRVFNSLHILCDFEVKGTVTHYEEKEDGRKHYKSGSLAKLPWNRIWNYAKLDQWKACATISLHALERIVNGLEKNPDDQVWAAHRQSLKAAETVAAVPVAPAVAAVPVAAAPLTTACVQPSPAKLTSFEAANANPDRLKANIDMARLYAQQVKRVPTVDVFLAFLHDNGYYTGSWEQTYTARRSRCKFVLHAYVESHFDPAKLKASAPTPIILDQWNNWAKQFPEHWVETLDRKGKIIRRHLDREDARVVFAINWALLHDRPNADSSVPYKWIMTCWEELYRTGKTTALPTQDKIGALRAAFHSRGIILITDPNYSPMLHKAIRYVFGPNAPGQSDYWKKKAAPKATPMMSIVAFASSLLIPLASATSANLGWLFISFTHSHYTTISRHGVPTEGSPRPPPC